MAKGDLLHVLAAADRTATTSSDDFFNSGYLGMAIVVNATAIAATETITVSLQYKIPGTSSYVQLAEFSAITAAGERVYVVYPGASDTTGATEVEIQAIATPYGDYKVTVTHSATGTHTYSVDVAMLP